MSYEDWRQQFDSDESAARRGFEQSLEMSGEVNELRRDIVGHQVAYAAMKAQRDHLSNVLREALVWIESDTDDWLRDLLHGQAGYSEMYTTIDKLRTIIEDGLKMGETDEHEKET